MSEKLYSAEMREHLEEYHPTKPKIFYSAHTGLEERHNVPAIEPRCKNCRWWAVNNVDYRGKDFKPCYAKGMCEDETSKVIPLNGVMALDGEWGFNVFESGPDFGCIHFEAKEGST